MHGRPTQMLGLVDVMLYCCLGFGTLNIHCLYSLVFKGVLDVGHLIPSTIRAGDHDFCLPHECTHHRPFVLEVMVGAAI